MFDSVEERGWECGKRKRDIHTLHIHIVLNADRLPIHTQGNKEGENRVAMMCLKHTNHSV